MRILLSRRQGIRAVAFLVVLSAVLARAEEPGWIDLSKLDSWKTPAGNWQIVGGVAPDAKNPNLLASTPGSGILVNGPTGKTTNLLSKTKFGDIEAHFEFLIPKRSNSGVKFEGFYEIQISDSHDVKTPKASDSGGIYPRAELLPIYRHIDDGYPPRVNAARPSGEWQTLDVIFHAPKFDSEGKKIAKARFEKVVLNGQVVHENVEVDSPTGHVWRQKEVPQGPILLQADHGPVAFRNIRVRPLPESSSR